MTDIIWGNGSDVLSNNSFVLNVTHRKDGNRGDYSDNERVTITSANLPGMPYDMSSWTKESLKESVIDAFLKCEVEKRDAAGVLLGRVSHSGAGGY